MWDTPTHKITNQKKLIRHTDELYELSTPGAQTGCIFQKQENKGNLHYSDFKVNSWLLVPPQRNTAR